MFHVHGWTATQKFWYPEDHLSWVINWYIKLMFIWLPKAGNSDKLEDYEMCVLLYSFCYKCRFGLCYVNLLGRFGKCKKFCYASSYRECWFAKCHLRKFSYFCISYLGDLWSSMWLMQQDGVFLLPGCCDPFNDKALRASRGASFQLSLVLGRWSNLKTLRNEFQMKLLAGHPESNAGQKLVSNLSPSFVNSLAKVPVCLVLGSEGRGLSEESESLCELVSIPMAGKFESLNVSVAGGIFLYMLQPQVHVAPSTFS